MKPVFCSLKHYTGKERAVIASSEKLEICELPNWAKQLADLTRIAWTGKDGKCYFPYSPLTTEEYWLYVVLPQWKSGEIHSWVFLSEQQKIIAHAALIKHDDCFELGRWIAYPDSPHWAVTSLCKKAMERVRKYNLLVKVETTQAHTSSQFIASQKLNLRFAGLGFLAEIDGISWDIIYYDNLPEENFHPKTGVLGNPLGKEIRLEERHGKRLKEISSILSTERGGTIPPEKFHILPHLLEPVSRIIQLNLASLEGKE